MKKQNPSKPDAQKAAVPAETLQAGAANDAKKTGPQSRPPHWERYVDSRMKQFCLR